MNRVQRRFGRHRLRLAGLFLLFLALALLRPVAYASAGAYRGQNEQAGSSEQLPAGLTAGEWATIQAQIGDGRYHAYAGLGNDQGGLLAANPAQGWQIAYTADGRTELSNHVTAQDTAGLGRAAGSGYWAWGLRLTGYGYGRNLMSLASRPGLTSEGNHVTYGWDDNLSEWWVNSPAGLEQGFTLQQRPAGARPGVPLRLEMAVRGTLRPVLQAGVIAFQDAQGAAVLTYDKLYVTDANGRRVPAGLAVDGQTIRILVEDAQAAYPLTIDPRVQQAYLKASNSEAGDEFGYSVAVSGDTVVVGAIWEDSNATGVNGNQGNNTANAAGAVYVFVRSGGAWSQQAYLKASNTDAKDEFGYAVAISGDTIVVGARGEDSNATGVNGNQADNSAEAAGAAYVFVRNGTTWSQQAYLKASNTEASDEFGSAVAISGDTVVVATKLEDSSATGINGDQGDNSATSAGAAYVFVRNGTSWSQQAYLKASNTGTGDNFGESVAISGDTIVVGAIGEDSSATGVNGNQNNNDFGQAGAAYLFVRSGTTWSQQAYLKASNTAGNDRFGKSVAVSGDTVVVGAYQEDSNAIGVNGNENDNSASNAGAAYVFVRSGTSWSQQAYLKASNTGADDWFGGAVAVSGDTIVVGAYQEDSSATGVNGNEADESASNAGAAYVFVRNGTSWSQQAYLKASNTGADDWFGWAVAVSGDTVVVGAYEEDSDATGINGNGNDDSAVLSGAAYLFRDSFCSNQSGSWDSTATWVGGAVPGSSDDACIAMGDVVYLEDTAAVNRLLVYPDAALDLSTFAFTSENGVTNHGTLSQTQTVNNANVAFLHIQNSAATTTHYRGVNLDTTANSQNLGAVEVGVRETVNWHTLTNGNGLDVSRYCTITGSASLPYAERCFTIIPTSQPGQPVAVRLWGLTNELNGIAPADLAVYRHYPPVSATWVELTSNASTGSDGGSYSYAQADTPGFSDFLLGEQGSAPTALTVSEAATHLPRWMAGVWLLVVGLIALFTAACRHLGRRQA